MNGIDRARIALGRNWVGIERRAAVEKKNRGGDLRSGGKNEPADAAVLLQHTTDDRYVAAPRSP